MQAIQEVLDAEKRLLPDRPPSITVSAIRDSAIDFQVIAYTRNEKIIPVQSDLQKDVIASFTRQGIELAVPLRLNLNSTRAIDADLPTPDSEG
jgi:small-conductance mechanosensitive channel